MEENGLTIRELVQYFFKRKILVLVLFLILTVVSFGGISFLKPATSSYKTNFMVAFEGIKSNKYPDGSFFSFKNIISYDSLVNAKESSDEFSTIDVDKLYENTAFKIENTDTSTNFDKSMYALSFELSVNSKYFTSDLQAANYIKYLIESNTYDKVNSYYDNFEIADYLVDITDTTEYIVILSKVNNLFKLLQEELNRAITATSLDYNYDNGKTLLMLKSEYEVFIKSLNLDAIENEYNENQYQREDKDTTAKDFEIKIQNMMTELEKYRKEIQLARNEALKETNFIFYDSNEIVVKVNSGYGILKSGVISIFVGLVGSIILTLCYGAYEDFAPIKSNEKEKVNN